MYFGKTTFALMILFLAGVAWQEEVQAQQVDLNARLRAQTPFPVGGQTRAAVRAQGIRGRADLVPQGGAQAGMMGPMQGGPQQGAPTGQAIEQQAGPAAASASPQWNWTPGTYGPWQFNPAGPNAALRNSYFGALRYNNGYYRNGYNPNGYNPYGYNPNGYNVGNGYFNNGYDASQVNPQQFMRTSGMWQGFYSNGAATNQVNPNQVNQGAANGGPVAPGATPGATTAGVPGR